MIGQLIEQEFKVRHFGRQHQARIYRAVVGACLEDPACSTVVTWGLADHYSFWEKDGGGLLGDALHFDADNRPKPAAFALAEVLEQHARARAAPAAARAGLQD